MEIGLIGTGRMGSAMGERLIDLGHRLTVWNRTAEKAKTLLQRGATPARSPGAVAQATELTLTVLADAKAFNAKVGTVWIACGDNDTTVQYPRIKTWAEGLEKSGIHETFRTYAGAHTWPVWRMSLADFAPLLFIRK